MNKITLTPTLLLLLLTISTFAQSLKNITQYTVSTKGKDRLHTYDFDTQTWAAIGETGTENLKALEFDNTSKTLYGVNEGKLGTIDITTGLFTSLGSVNVGEGEYGMLVLDDIEDLAFDIHHKMLYAIHRVPDNGPGTNDVIFKIDPTTGSIVKNGLRNSSNDLVDYVIIDAVINTENGEDLYDLSGISYDPYSHKFFAIHMQRDNSATQDYNAAVISEIEADSDMVLLNRIAYDTPISNLHDLCYGGNGEFYSIESSLNQIIDFDRIHAINLADHSSTAIGDIEPGGSSNNFRSLALAYPINDLALKVTLNPNQNLPIFEEDIVTFDITVYNQGEVTINQINLAAHIADKTFLEDDSWSEFENKSYKNILQTIEPGAFITTSLEIELDEGFDGEIRTAVEIESAFSNSFTDDEGYTIRLADIDSQPGDSNYALNIVDNDINGGGPHKNEDEDDHDIEVVNVIANLATTDCACYSVAQNNGAANELFGYNESTGNWYKIGETNTSNLKALTYNQITHILYGIEDGKLGTIDVTTGQFTSFGVVNFGEGAYGQLALDDIEGLTYNPHLEVLYAVHRVTGDGPGTNDVLFKIDPETGLIIKNGMQKPDGNTIDYVTISEVQLEENIPTDTYDVYDITYNPYTNQLVGLHTKEEADQTLFTEIDKNEGYVETIMFDEQSRVLKSLTSFKNGQYYAIANRKDDLSELVFYDMGNNSSSHIGYIAPTGNSQNFQSLACSYPINDLALNYATCIDERYISETLNSDSYITSGLYKANNTIISDGIIPFSGQDVNYKAGNLIQLDIGFEVKKGSDFSAKIEECE